MAGRVGLWGKHSLARAETHTGTGQTHTQAHSKQEAPPHLHRLDALLAVGGVGPVEAVALEQAAHVVGGAWQINQKQTN